MTVTDSYPREEYLVVGFEAPLECLLEPKREHDEPRVIRVAVTQKKRKKSPG